MWFLLSSSLPPRVRGGGGVWRACVNSAGDCHAVVGGRKDLGEEIRSFTGAGGVSM